MKIEDLQPENFVRVVNPLYQLESLHRSLYGSG